MHLVETMAYAGKTPWHGLGKSVSADLSPEEFLVESDLNWTVKKVPLKYRWNGQQMVSERMALIRDTDGRELTTITDEWEPCQNIEAFEFFNEFVRAGHMKMETGGSLRNGQIVWALAKVSDGFKVFGGDRVESYLLFTNPHIYGRSIDIRFTPVRVVCNNTLTLSLREKVDMVVKASHRQKFNPEEVKATLGIAQKKLADYKGMAEFLGSKKYTNTTVLNYIRELFPHASGAANDNKMSLPAQKIFDRLEDQPGSQYANGTWWQAFNAVTYTTDHILGRTDEGRLHDIWYGQMRNKKIKALERAVEFAEAA